MEVVILRGLPGSGKSHYARQLVDANVARDKFHNIIVSADNYFVDFDGSYKFNPTELGDAHDACYRQFASYVPRAQFDLIVVDNTNTQAYEIAPYYVVANYYGADVRVAEVVCDPEIAFSRQTHNVPRHVWSRMAENMKNPLPRHWNVCLYRSWWRPNQPPPTDMENSLSGSQQIPVS